ncbi:hypothetical protein [Ectobacillus ponti]|uniref:Uracil-DNA glycosylase n=1 Tax=Ectobacillus ponti TaxID=2961894 RepID=A0AA42BQX1_9BACI|nr:hypothetical protein [Ectobacillus ponti]MCP8968904.1 hypothetical protein [Ectobacillus ponti]
MASIHQVQEFLPALQELLCLETLTRENLLHPRFLLQRESGLEIYYAPFDYINTAAKVMIVGITPGWTQMQLSYTTVLDALRRGEPPEEGVRRVKQQASFAGSMRTNLNAMLDELELPGYLGIPASSDLFGAGRELLHPCSLLRYPVFRNNLNYTGHNPQMVKSPLLLDWIRTVFVPEWRSVHPLVLIPLGKAVSDALQHLAQEGLLEEERCLFGFPHPSGANGHRHKQFQEGKASFVRKLQYCFT